MKNKLVETLLLLLFTTALLTIISFFPFHMGEFGSPDFLSEIKTSSPSKHINYKSKEQLAAQDSAFVEPTKLLADTSFSSFGDFKSMSHCFSHFYLLVALIVSLLKSYNSLRL
jgi:hypothetical protein